jgi:hypothetical protein
MNTHISEFQLFYHRNRKKNEKFINDLNLGLGQGFIKVLKMDN